MVKIIFHNMKGMTERRLPLQPSEWQKQMFVVAPAILTLWHIPRCTLGLFWQLRKLKDFPCKTLNSRLIAIMHHTNLNIHWYFFHTSRVVLNNCLPTFASEQAVVCSLHCVKSPSKPLSIAHFGIPDEMLEFCLGFKLHS